MSKDFPYLGFGVGLRKTHYAHILEKWPTIDWFEIISENYMIPGGRPLAILERIRERYPVVMHGVSLSIGSVDPLDRDYLKKLKALAERIKPAWVSDHLCWSSTGRHSLHDLLPIPQTEEAMLHVIDRVRQVQDYLGRQILLENVSTYLEFSHSTITEWEFLNTIAKESDCKILLDVNNVYVSAINHGFDPLEYLRNIEPSRVGQFHLAGHTDTGTFLHDTHDHPIIEQVWNLYEAALKDYGTVSTLIEWDDHIPPFNELMKEVERAKERFNKIIGEPDAIRATGTDARFAHSS